MRPFEIKDQILEISMSSEEEAARLDDANDPDYCPESVSESETDDKAQSSGSRKHRQKSTINPPAKRLANSNGEQSSSGSLSTASKSETETPSQKLSKKELGTLQILCFEFCVSNFVFQILCFKFCFSLYSGANIGNQNRFVRRELDT